MKLNKLFSSKESLTALTATMAWLFLLVISAPAARALDIPLKEKTAGLFLKKAKATSGGNQPRVVKLHRVGKGISQNGIAFPGKVEASRKAKLFFRVSGPVIEQDLILGKPVQEGDILMRIDPRDYQREVDALARQIEALEAQNALASMQYERKKNLLATKSISRTEFDAADAENKVSRAQLMALRINHKKATDRLNDTSLRAPFTGNVTALGVERYELAQAGATVVVLEDLHTLKVRIHIPASRLPDALAAPLLGKEQQFRVRIPGRPGDFLAVLSEFSPSASTGGESFEAVLTMNQPEGQFILPGMSAEASLYIDSPVPSTSSSVVSGNTTSFVVPWSAVVNENGVSFVWIYDPVTKKIRKCTVQTERAAGADSALVKGNIATDDLIVAAGGDWLTESTEVRVLNPEVLNAGD